MAMNSQEQFFPSNLTWNMSHPVTPMPLPGKTPFL
jgi:hypothetical protein